MTKKEWVEQNFHKEIIKKEENSSDRALEGWDDIIRNTGKEKREEMKVEKFKELIYAPSEVEGWIKKRFSNAKIADASDDIHTERFELELDVPEEFFYRFAIRKGFAKCCFCFLCRLRDGDKEIERWIEEETQLGRKKN